VKRPRVRSLIFSSTADLDVAAATVALRAGSPLSRALGDWTPQAAYTIAFLLVALLPTAAIPGIIRMQRDAGRAPSPSRLRLRPAPASRAANLLTGRRAGLRHDLDLVTVVSKVCGVPRVNPRSLPPRAVNANSCRVSSPGRLHQKANTPSRS